MTSRICRIACLAAALSIGFAVQPAARADVTLPAVLSDHMVLQQGQPVPVWGSAGAGEAVTVSFAGQTEKTTAGADGKWIVKLKPLTANESPAELTVAGKNTVKVTDILVGEVWVCSGQSNMYFALQNAKDGEQEVAAAKYPTMRLFAVPKTPSVKPLTDTKSKWEACTPESAASFTAVGYFFGRELQKALHVPIGLVHTSYGGTPAEAWTAAAYLEKDPDFKSILERREESVASYKKRKEEFEKNLPTLTERWKANAEKAKKAGTKVPREPAPPASPARDPKAPSVLYNGMVAPLVPFAARGAIWYQGEANAARAHQYRKLLPAMIQSWRDAWGMPELPFLIVQLANFQAVSKEPGNDDWAELREAQAMTAAMPHNGLATAVDLGDAADPMNIHPKNKQEVGRRLALVAQAKVYGRDIVYSGPLFDSMKIENGKAALKFKFAEGMHPKGNRIQGFQIAGEDRKWKWAQAEVSASGEVVVSNPAIPEPVAVRYDWSHNPQGNVYNGAELPMLPFRTDDWPGKTDARK